MCMNMHYFIIFYYHFYCHNRSIYKRLMTRKLERNELNFLFKLNAMCYFTYLFTADISANKITAHMHRFFTRCMYINRKSVLMALYEECKPYHLVYKINNAKEQCVYLNWEGKEIDIISCE